MKIKTDFVTNSSSTAYVFFLPSNYIIKEEDLQKCAEEWFDEYVDDDTETIEDYKKKIVEGVETLKAQHYLYHEESYQVYTPILEILDKGGYELISIDVDSSSGQIHIVDTEKIKEMIAIEELITMKGELNATETQK